jgi:two-component system, chemotaxis family, chemotaxis protein CheY
VQVPVGERRRLRCARGAGGEHEHRRIIRCAVDDRRWFGLRQARDLVGTEGDDDLAGERACRRGRRTGGGARRVQRRHDTTDADGSQVGNREQPVVGTQNGDTVPGLESETDEAAPQASDFAGEVAVGRGDTPGDDRDGIFRMAVDDGREIHGTTPPPAANALHVNVRSVASDPADDVIKVMIVDDTDHVRRMLRNMLELDGFLVVGEAGNGPDAVAAIDTAGPDVVVIDYKMPEVDGLETAARIRAKRPDQVMILYTAFVDPELEARARDVGVSVVLGKIEGLESLEREITRLCGTLF